MKIKKLIELLQKADDNNESVSVLYMKNGEEKIAEIENINFQLDGSIFLEVELNQ